MSSFMAFGSRRISLAECSGSSFALVISCLCAYENLPLPSTSMRAISGRSRSMRRARFPTGTRRYRSSDEGHSSLG
jgi:hypothetical protein